MADVNAAVVAFEQNNLDIRAAVVHGITGLPGSNGTFGAPFPAVQLFYDGPNLPAGTFADFFAIPTVSNTWASPITFLNWSGTDGGVSNLRCALDYVLGRPTHRLCRGAFHAFSTLPHTAAFLQDVVDELTVRPAPYPRPLHLLTFSYHQAFGAELGPKSAAFLSVAIEPFMSTALTIDNKTAHSSAYPPVRSPVLLPSNIFFGCVHKLYDLRAIHARWQVYGRSRG
jgi:hypothetical protein